MADPRRALTPAGVLRAGAVAGLVALIAFGAAFATVDHRRRARASRDLPPPARPVPVAEVPATFLTDRNLQDMTLLFLGVGPVRPGRRTKPTPDTVLLVRYSGAARKVQAIALPRETRIPGDQAAGQTTGQAAGQTGVQRLDAALGRGDPADAARTAARFLGIAVPRYLMVRQEAVEKAVDAIGGVEVTIASAMHYDDVAGGVHIRLQPGRRRLTGRQAMDYLRFVQDGSGTELGRMRRQKAFIRDGGAQFLRPAALLRLPAVLGAVREYSETDLTPSEMLQLAMWARHLDARRDIALSVLPGRYERIAGARYWVPDMARFRKLSGATFVDRAAPAGRSAARP